MTIEFQKEILRYLVQSKDGRKYIGKIEYSLFDLPEYGAVYQLIEKYFDSFKTIPKRVSLLEFFDKATKNPKNKVAPEVKRIIETLIVDLYEPMEADNAQVHEEIVNWIQYKMTKELFEKYAVKIKDGGLEIFNKCKKEIDNIVDIAKEDEQIETRGGFLLKDHATSVTISHEGTPIFLRGVNKLTAAGGFYSPQLIVLLGAPKSFKTGTLLKTAVELVRDGSKVYYADCENGINAVRTRSQMAMLECERYEIKQYKTELDDIVQRYQALGGDLHISFYPTGSKTLDDVDKDLEYLKETHNWIPDVIVYDYIDLFKPANETVQKKDKRFHTQDTYPHAVRLNNKYGCWSITVSTVRREAISKKVINIKDFGEDIQKAYNCHAAFAICRTPEEVEEGLARIVVVAQREGEPPKGSNEVLIRIDEKRMVISEVKYDEMVQEILLRRGNSNTDTTDD